MYILTISTLLILHIGFFLVYIDIEDYSFIFFYLISDETAYLCKNRNDGDAYGDEKARKNIY